ncbi:MULTISPECIES: hypothetical protein [Bacillus]|uniref:Uncharacterized protein n=3 Tax=Bacillus cereus group TaxID=86661 RepID=A0A9X6W274_BACCE|nr:MULTISPECIES: hypothetical protein [Bacillus]PEZ74986.1 hypothetical protein CN410_12715 [Bacillus anthracis]AFV22009.1 hypothetical protein BTB_502p07040 [Bacillus thuringiensis Bt407]EEM24970.1 hypothetical protein bthur0002_56120 [Bacillus thuringiensis Bt407]ERI00813.1 hypothetical protein BTCBT_002368 [Bacillus thuringiensis T01-328]KXY51430.1 hypothetical protein AT268_33705 [Bacillus cereus]
MSLTYEKLMALMDANKNIKEFCIIEGKPLFLGVVKELEKPIIRNGRLVTHGILNEQCEDFGVIQGNDCLDVLKGFERSTQNMLIPDENNQPIMFRNDKFRLIVFDKPLTPNGFNIQYWGY